MFKSREDLTKKCQNFITKKPRGINSCMMIFYSHLANVGRWLVLVRGGSIHRACLGRHVITSAPQTAGCVRIEPFIGSVVSLFNRRRSKSAKALIGFRQNGNKSASTATPHRLQRLVLATVKIGHSGELHSFVFHCS